MESTPRPERNFPMAWARCPMRGKLRDGRAALYGEGRARQVAGVVAQEEHRDVGDVFGLRVAPERNAATRALLRFRSREHAARHRRIDPTRTNAVDAHAPRSVLHRQKPRERVDATLARGVPGPLTM